MVLILVPEQSKFKSERPEIWLKPVIPGLMVKTLKIKSEQMKKSNEKGFLGATELADYLAKNGVPFRQAHEIVKEGCIGDNRDRIGDAPVEGTSYSVGNTIGSSIVSCVVSSSTANCTDLNLIGGTVYHYKIFTKDSNGNYSSPGVIPSGSPFTPTAKVVSITIPLNSGVVAETPQVSQA
jgi:hypothetical protein